MSYLIKGKVAKKSQSLLSKLREFDETSAAEFLEIE